MWPLTSGCIELPSAPQQQLLIALPQLGSSRRLVGCQLLRCRQKDLGLLRLLLWLEEAPAAALLLLLLLLLLLILCSQGQVIQARHVQPP
jgi:hypothetical protein